MAEKNKHFRPSKTKTHRLSYAGKWDFAFDKSLSRTMARHRQQCHQATSERQIALGPLSLIYARALLHDLSRAVSIRIGIFERF